MADTVKDMPAGQDIEKTMVLSSADVTVRIPEQEKRTDNVDDTMISHQGTIIPDLSETKTFFSSVLAGFTGKNISVDESIPPVSGPPLNWNTVQEKYHSGLKQNYTILDRLGRGGQGTVDRALDLPLGREVAVKTLHEEFLDDARSRAFFRQEAMVTAQLDHPSIIPVYALCSDGKSCHIVMKLAKGTSLEEVIQQTADGFLAGKKNRFTEIKDLRNRIEIFLAVCNAMEYAHARHVLHRDLKPENIMTGAFHETYIMDWGLAEPFTPVDDSLPDPPNMTGNISGTPRYLAPEIIMKKQIDQRSDIFALGLMLFEIVTLKHAYEGANAEDVMRNILSGKMESLSHRFKVPIDGDLKAIIRKACAIRRTDRYKTVRKLADDVRRYLDGLEVAARPDNLPRKILRASVRHRVFLLVSLLILLVLLTVSAARSFKESWKKEQRKRQYDMALSTASSACVEKANRFSGQILRLEASLENFAGNAADMLADRDNIFLSGKEIPADIVRSSKLILKDTECRFPDRFPEVEKRRIMRLFPMLERGLRTIAMQTNGRIIGKENVSATSYADYPCPKVYLTLDNGVRMGYPSWNVPADGFDGRTRPWYKTAEKNPDTTIWNAPYADVSLNKTVTFTLSKAIVHPVTGKVLGVVGVDLTLRHIRREITPTKREAAFISNRVLVDKDGQVLLSLNPEYRVQILSDDSLLFPRIEQKELSKLIRSGGAFGYRTVKRDDGKDYVFFKSFISGPGWYYIEEVDLASLLEKENGTFSSLIKP